MSFFCFCFLHSIFLTCLCFMCFLCFFLPSPPNISCYVFSVFSVFFFFFFKLLSRPFSPCVFVMFFGLPDHQQSCCFDFVTLYSFCPQNFALSYLVVVSLCAAFCFVIWWSSCFLSQHVVSSLPSESNQTKLWKSVPYSLFCYSTECQIHLLLFVRRIFFGKYFQNGCRRRRWLTCIFSSSGRYS